MKSILERFKNEPVLLAQAAAVIIGLGAAWGLTLTDIQTGAVMAALAFVGALVGRGQVTPTRAIAAEETEAGVLVAGEASDVRTGEPVDVVPAGGDDYEPEHGHPRE